MCPNEHRTTVRRPLRVRARLAREGHPAEVPARHCRPQVVRPPSRIALPFAPPLGVRGRQPPGELLPLSPAERHLRGRPVHGRRHATAGSEPARGQRCRMGHQPNGLLDRRPGTRPPQSGGVRRSRQRSRGTIATRNRRFVRDGVRALRRGGARQVLPLGEEPALRHVRPPGRLVPRLPHRGQRPTSAPRVCLRRLRRVKRVGSSSSERRVPSLQPRAARSGAGPQRHGRVPALRRRDQISLHGPGTARQSDVRDRISLRGLPPRSPRTILQDAGAVGSRQVRTGREALGANQLAVRAGRPHSTRRRVDPAAPVGVPALQANVQFAAAARLGNQLQADCPRTR